MSHVATDVVINDYLSGHPLVVMSLPDMCIFSVALRVLGISLLLVLRSRQHATSVKIPASATCKGPFSTFRWCRICHVIVM